MEKANHLLTSIETHQHCKNKRQEEETDSWRYVVLFASFLIMVSLKFPLTTFGIMYSGLLMDSDVSTLTSSWIYNLSQFSLDIIALFVAPFCEAFGWRKTAFAAGFIFAFSTCVSGFIDDPLYLFITFSLLTGSSIGILIAICSFIVPVYFHKGRGFAIGIQYAGLSIGDFVAPQVVYLLQQWVGLRSALFILGAIVLNICAASLVFHPVEWHQMKKTKLRGQSNLINDNKIVTAGPVSDPKATWSQIEPNQAPDSQRHSIDDGTEEIKAQNSKDAVGTLKGISNSLLESLKMLQYFRVWIISSTSGLIIIGHIDFLMLVPFALKDRGMPMDSIIWYISTIGFSNLISRLLMTALTDLLTISNKWFMMAGILASSVSIAIFSVHQSPVVAYVCMGLFGFGLGTCLPLIPMVAIEFMGIDLLPRIFGVNGLFNAAGFIIFAPIIGHVRDVTGSYDFTLQLLCIPLLMAFLAWCLMPCAMALDKRRDSSISYVSSV